MEENINISELFEIIKLKWKIIATSVIVFLVCSIVLSFFIIKPQYETKVKVFIGKGVTADKQSGYDNSEVTMYQNLLGTYANVIQTNSLVEAALQNSDIDLNSNEVLKKLEVTPVANTQILEISYRDTNRERAVKVIDSITNQFIKRSKTLISNGNVQVLEEASYPKNAVSPHKTLNILIGLILGLIVGIAISVGLEMMDNTFKTPEDLGKIVGVPVIGIITVFDEKNGKQLVQKNGKKRWR
ncbi:MAG: YveK family protein [Clostridium sp.]|uniref:YveK family protein n=1 Tax=Clostridium sp. TaxID=1506 RepID=UPI003F2E30F8